MKLAILGCGPSGLVAAHAAMTHGSGRELNIFSINQKSPIYGAQYLHQPIPYTLASAAVEPRVIRYVMQGDPEQYLKKVYGAKWDGTINDDLRDQAHLAWDIRKTYDELWDTYAGLIVPSTVPHEPAGARRVVATLTDEFDMVVNTIPRPALCVLRGQHRFVSTDIWAMGDAPGREVPYACQDEIIHYNGLSEQSWYRISKMYGFTTVEWPGHAKKPPWQNVARVSKPLSHNCDCFPEVIHLGRMGRWQNGRLVHHVYADMVEQLILREQAA